MGVDVATIGETMVLMVPEPPADPVDASVFRRTLGGAESNVAITLSRLGAQTSWHSALGDDAFGHYIADHVRQQGVQCHLRHDSDRVTALYLKEIRESGTTVRYYRKGSAASQLTSEDADALLRMNPRVIHTTGITPWLSETNHATIQQLWKRSGTSSVKSFDVNFRPALHSANAAPALQALANSSDIVFCGDDEAAHLWGTSTAQDVRQVLNGPQLLIVKHGAHGASVFTPSGTHFEPARTVDVVEVVGAGDALASGFLFGHLQGLEPQHSLALGTELAARAVQITGDLPDVEPLPSIGQD